MKLKIAIFEDDKDVADVLSEMLQDRNFEVTNFYTIEDRGWNSCDLILGDYRNRIVSFNRLRRECEENEIPLIAISGAETDYSPYLIKPFSIEALEAIILDTIRKNEKGYVAPSGFKKAS